MVVKIFLFFFVDNFPSCLLLHLFSLFWANSLSDYFFDFCIHLSLVFHMKNFKYMVTRERTRETETEMLIFLVYFFKCFSTSLRPVQCLLFLSGQLLSSFSLNLPFIFCSLVLNHLVFYTVHESFSYLGLGTSATLTSYSLLHC